LGYGDSTSNLKSDIIKADPIIYVENPIHHARWGVQTTHYLNDVFCSFISLFCILNAVACSISFVDDDHIQE
jgi:hypothetical protein